MVLVILSCRVVRTINELVKHKSVRYLLMHNAIIIILMKFHVPSSNPFSVYGRNKDLFSFNFNWKLIILQYCGGFCHTFTWISHGVYMCSPSWNPFHLPPHPIPLVNPSAPALSTLSHALNLNWWSISHMIIYMFQCYSLKLSHLHLLPQSPTVCYLHLCLFCWLAYRIIVTIFLNSIYMC